MGEHYRSIDPATLEPHIAYGYLLHAVSPRPIAFVSTLSAQGEPNLAPFSFFIAGGANPPSVIISPTTPRSGVTKDTLQNIQETGEYTISVVTYAMRERMNQASAAYPHGVSEWTEAGFEPAVSETVKPPRVAESPIALECRLHRILQHGDGPLSANYVIGEAVRFHFAEDMFDETGKLDPRRVDYIARMGGAWYVRVEPENMFELPRASAPS